MDLPLSSVQVIDHVLKEIMNHQQSLWIIIFWYNWKHKCWRRRWLHWNHDVQLPFSVQFILLNSDLNYGYLIPLPSFHVLWRSLTSSKKKQKNKTQAKITYSTPTEMPSEWKHQGWVFYPWWSSCQSPQRTTLGASDHQLLWQCSKCVHLTYDQATS